MAGRPTKLTPEVQARVIQAIRAGNYAEVAAQYAGIDEGTFYRWMERGRQEGAGRFREFRVSVEKAKADAEVRDVAIIAKAADESWQAAAWRLERRFPDRWGRRERVNVDHAGGVQVTERHEYDVAQRIIADPAALALAHRLAVTLADGAGEAGGTPQ